MHRVFTKFRLRIGVLGALALLVGSGLTASPMMATTAHAAYGVCNTTAWPDVPDRPGDNRFWVPARTNNGLSCYMGYQQGSRSAVEAVQLAVIQCYNGTWAAQRIRSSGGADGVYGVGTVEAVKWLQKNRFGFTGSDADGVYGPKTRAKLQWPLFWHGAQLITCSNPSTF
jgi:murein L,D-transpeptidase YcbB/YkuD